MNTNFLAGTYDCVPFDLGQNVKRSSVVCRIRPESILRATWTCNRDS